MTLYCHASLNTISNCSVSATGLCAQPRSWHMGGALCRRCDNYLGSGRWRCFSKVRCLSAASSDFWKTLLATFQSLSSFHRRSLSRPYASSSASVKPRNPATPKEKRPHMQPLTHITIETISNPTSDHPEIIRADNPPVSLKLKPLIMKLRLIISSLKFPQKHLIIIITANLQGKTSLIHNRKSHKGILV